MLETNVSENRKAIIYLADLTHTGVTVATESFPLNIGLVASYAKRHLGDAIEVRLFKYPEKLITALKDRVPDILGCSNYVWNSNLSEWMLGYAKRLNPEVVTVQGGTNYPFSPSGQLEFLRTHLNTDFHVYYEGEVAFLQFLRRYLETRSLEGMKQAPIEGCQYLSPYDGSLVSAPAAVRIKELDDIPSPYTTGILDEFFDGKLTPMMETTRGCPFACNFCNAGDKYFNKINMFSLEYFLAELEYIAPRISAVGVSHLTLADNNFGMYPRDADICHAIKDVRDKYGWPMGLIATTGKNSKERIIKATEILGPSLLVSMSVQSTNPVVLKNIKRDNIKLDHYKQINKTLTQQGRTGMAEVILPLPGETYESFLSGIESLIEAGAAKVTSYTIQLLYGTDYKEPEYRKKWGYVGKWRQIPYDFGEYGGERVFDAEEVAVSNNTISFNDYLNIRGFALTTEIAFNNYIFHEILRYIQEYGISSFKWLRMVWDCRENFPEEIQNVFASFIADTKNELFDTEADLRLFYGKQENYERLVRGEIGGNVIFKHKTMALTQHIAPWLKYITKTAENLVKLSTPDEREMEQAATEIAEIRYYLECKLNGILDSTSTEPIIARFHYDILAWMKDENGSRLRDYYRPGGVSISFHFSDQQLTERRDGFQRYGTHLLGLTKILQRIPSHDRLFRQVAYATGQIAVPST
ncbi:MAG: radical SAM protein [Nitrosomonadales bacterium]|nr:radical SAM protein [Nitrosomonadales bacterium]